MCEIAGSANWWQYVRQQTAWKVVAAAALGNVIAAAIRVRAVCGNPHGAADVPRDCRASAARGVQEVGKHHEIWELGKFREHVALEDSEARLEVQGGHGTCTGSSGGRTGGSGGSVSCTQVRFCKFMKSRKLRKRCWELGNLRKPMEPGSSGIPGSCTGS